KDPCPFPASLAQLSQANAAVFGISADGPWVLKEFAARQHLNFRLLSDFFRTTTEQYGGAQTEGMFKGIPKLAVFVLDGQGIVRHKEITANPGVEPDYGRVFATLDGIRP